MTKSKRGYWFGTMCCAVAIATAAVFAGIPEPDTTVWGRVFIAQQPQGKIDDVTVNARIDRAPTGNLPGAEDPIVGTYYLGDVDIATNACDGSDCFVLGIRLESLADGAMQSSNSAVVGDTVYLCTKRGAEPEVCRPGDQLVIPGNRAYVENRDIGDLPIPGDWDNDGDVTLADYAAFPACMAGPEVGASIPCKLTFDFDADADVDLSDYEVFMRALAGS